MSLTPQDICNNALTRLGAASYGQTPDPSLVQAAFARLNVIVDRWATQKLTINGIQKFSLAAIAGHNPYTIGPGGDFNQARPIWIASVTITLAGTIPTDIPVDIVDALTYANMIAAKTTQSSVPQIAYYDQAGPPTGNLNLWPVLNDVTVTLNIWVSVALVQFTGLTQAISLLPGYQAALEYALAADLIPEIGRPLDDKTAGLIMQRAGETLGEIKRANIAPTIAQCDPGLLTPGQIVGGGSWYSGP